MVPKCLDLRCVFPPSTWVENTLYNFKTLNAPCMYACVSRYNTEAPSAAVHLMAFDLDREFDAVAGKVSDADCSS